MSVKLDRFEETISKLRPKLYEYLEEHGIEARSNAHFPCINPEHDDSSPSMSVFEPEPGKPLVHCFGCGFTGDIFTVAHVLEHKPKIGPGFISDNVAYLADKFDVDMPVRQLTEEEIYEYNMYEAYAMAAEYISTAPMTDLALQECERRGWDPKEIRKYMVGVCDDYNNFRENLKAAGLSAKFLDEIDLSNKRIFSPNNLIFTVCDDYGRPVGFVARNLKYDGVKDQNNRLINGPKFNNTRTTGVRCNIFRKSERLYLMHIARESKSSPIYIVEGHGDALTAHMHGLDNCVAIGSLDLNEHQLNQCRRNGIFDVVICLDADESGQKKARRLIEDVLRNVHDIRIRFIFLPEKTDENGNVIKVDPDLFIRENGIEAFVNLPKVDPFEWMLMEYVNDDESDAEKICFSMIPIIMNEPSPIKREKMIRELSNYTGYHDKVIRDELDRLLDDEEAEFQRKKSAIIDQVKLQLQKRSESAEIVLQRGVNDLYKLETERNRSAFSPDAVLNNLVAIKQYEEDEEIHSAINFGRNFETLSVALSGDLRGKMIVVGGTGNTGKTSMFCNLAWNLVQENDNIMSIFLTIDDSAKELVPRLVTYDIAARTYDENQDLFEVLSINKIATPFLFKEELEYDAIMEEREHSYSRLFSMARDERIVILDIEQGRSIDFINSTVKHYTDKYPDRQIVFFLDNFHLVDVPGLEEGRMKYKTLSKDLKQICTMYGVTVITTAEYRKLQRGQKPSNNDLSETVALEYDSNVIIHLYSELHDLREGATSFFYDANGNKLPIIEQDFGKNKINSFKGTIYYKFFPDKAMYLEITERQAMLLKESNKQAMLDSLNGIEDDEGEGSEFRMAM